MFVLWWGGGLSFLEELRSNSCNYSLKEAEKSPNKNAQPELITKTSHTTRTLNIKIRVFITSIISSEC